MWCGTIRLEEETGNTLGEKSRILSAPVLNRFLSTSSQASAVVGALYSGNVPQTLLQLMTTLPQQV